MAVTGITNGYNMYMNPYDAGNMAKTADTAAARTAGAAFDEKDVQDGKGTAEKAALENAGSTGRAAAQEGAQGAAARLPFTVGTPLMPGISIGATNMPAISLSATGMPLPLGSEAEEELSPEESADPDAQKKIGRKSSPEECQTCKERKYQDGSDENVSFKAAAHISPEAAGAAVRAHEGEHVSNAYKEAAENGGKVINASVMIHTAICPECGRTYVSGGTTSTTIRYSKEENPYEKAKKAQEAMEMRGKNIDYAA